MKQHLYRTVLPGRVLDAIASTYKSVTCVNSKHTCLTPVFETFAAKSLRVLFDILEG